MLTTALLILGPLAAIAQQSDVRILGRSATQASASNLAWYTADLHVHANGCNSHYPASKLLADMRTTKTNIADVLVWGTSIAFDWQEFRGHENDPLSLPNHIMRWDFEISEFPEDWQGHMIMLNVAQKNAVLYGVPNWPGQTYLLPNYDWVQGGGGIVGYAHANFWTSGSFDFAQIDDRCPRAMILDVTQKKVDFISTEYIQDPDFYWFWYKMLDAGFHVAPTGSSDWPCQSKLPGIGAHHTAFPLPATQRLTFDAYVDAVRAGKTVIRQNTNPLDHLDMRVNGQGLGSEIHLPSSRIALAIEVDVSSAEPGAEVQLVVNGKVIDTIPVGPNLKTVQWSVASGRSSWVAARIVEGGGARIRTHTAATFVLFAGCPIRNDPVSALKWIDFLDDYAAAAFASVPFQSADLFLKQQFRDDIDKAKRTWLKIAADGFFLCHD
jgi:hypothetical protein